MNGINLDNGLTVNFDRVYINQCYEGQIIGWPDEDTQHEYITDSEKAIQDRLGNYPTHLIRPKIFYDEVNQLVRMPWWRVGVYLTGPEIACKGEGVGSHLIVVFFTEDPFGKELRSLVEEAVHELDWEQLADNFDL